MSEKTENNKIELLDKVLIKVNVKHIKSGTSLNCNVNARVMAMGIKDHKDLDKGLWYRVLIDDSLYPIEIDENDIINKIENET